jgi:hypothetical protein
MATQTKVTDYDYATGDTVERDMSAEEIEKRQAVIDEEEARRQDAVLKAEAKAGLLARLGITPEEAELLLA